MKTQRGFPVTFWLLACLLIVAMCRQLFSALSWAHDSYQMTEWLINYAGGFVRRGLPGSLIGMVSAASGIQANHLAIAISMICFLILCAWLLRRATTTFPAVLILSCVAMGIPAYQDSIVRKDCLGLLLLLGCLHFERSRLSRPVAIGGVNLLACAAILCHETFVFYALAGMVVFNRDETKTPAWPALLRRGFFLVPAGIAFLLAVIHHGTPRHAAAVNDSWIPLWNIIDPGNQAIGTPDASIAALGWTTGQGLSLSLHMLTTGFYQPMAWVLVFVVSLVLVALFTGRDRDANTGAGMTARIRVTALLLEQLAFISPLFLLGVDYGRWLFLWVVSTMIFHTFGLRASMWMESIVRTAFEAVRMHRIVARFPAHDWYLLFFGVPVCWNLHNFLTASPLARHFDIIRSLF
ncbi:MAG: hypothetical protein ACO3JG_01510 [Luteolibacter sp.]